MVYLRSQVGPTERLCSRAVGAWAHAIVLLESICAPVRLPIDDRRSKSIASVVSGHPSGMTV